MALQKQALPVRFAGGVETKLDEKGVAYTKLLELENGVFDKAVSLIKRNGYDALPQTLLGTVENLTGVTQIGVRGTELVAFTPTLAYSFVESADAWQEIGRAQSVQQDERVVAKTGTEQTRADCATNEGVTVFAWEDSTGGVWYAVEDEETGRLVTAPTQLDADGSRPRCVAAGDKLHVYYVDATPGELYCVQINPANLAGAISTVMLSNALDSANLGYDVCATTRSGTPAAIAWYNDSGALTIGYVDQSGVLGSPATGHPFTADHAVSASGGLAIAHDDNRPGLAVAYVNADNNANAIIVDGDDPSTVVLAATQVIAGGAEVKHIACCFEPDEVSAGVQRLQVLATITASAVRDYFTTHRSITTAGTLGTAATIKGCSLASCAFSDGSDVYAHLIHDATFYATFFCLCVTSDDAAYVARTLPGLAGGTVTVPHLPRVHDLEDRRYRWAAVFRAQVESEDGDQFSERGIRLVTMDFDADGAHRTVQLGNTLYIAGAMPLAYDGRTAAEAQISYAADGTITTTPASGGSMTSSATYQYVFVYEVLMANGELLVGPTSIGTTVTMGGSDTQVTIAIPTYRQTMWPRVRIGVFRTEANPESLEAVVFYRVSSLDPSDTGANGYVLNDTTTNTVSFEDELSDDDLIAREPLYTNGGILVNDPLPGCTIVAGGKNRLFCNDVTDPLVVRYSQEQREGFAAEFAPELQLKVDPYGGAITALAVMDNVVVIFKRTAIYYFGGNGPLANPDAGGGFTAPELITSDVGCIAAESIGITPVGIMFQSAKGIYLLGRDRSVRYIGAAVESYNAQAVRAATLIDDKTQVRVLTDAADGLTLLYDYYFDQWSTFTNHLGYGAAVVDGTYHYLRTDGTVYRETPDEHQDDTLHIRLAIGTAWIRLVDLMQGMQRVWAIQILGTFKTEHLLRVSYALDYEDHWSNPVELDPSLSQADAFYGEGNYGEGVYGGEPVTRYQFQVHLNKKCQAIRFRFEDVEPASVYGPAFELAELLVIGGVQKPESRPLGNTRSS